MYMLTMKYATKKFAVDFKLFGYTDADSHRTNSYDLMNIYPIELKESDNKNI